MLDDKDRIFKNLYGLHDWGLEGARKRGAWDGTKAIIDKGRDWIIAEMKKEEQTQLAALRSENAKLRAENAANAKRLATLETRDNEREARLTRLEISMPATQPVANTIASNKAGGQ